MQTNKHRPHQTNQIEIRPTTLARTNHQGSNSEKINRTIRIRRWPHFIYTTQRIHQPRKNANLVLLFTAIQHGLPQLHETTQTTKNLRSLLGLGLKFIPTPSLTNSWSRLRKSSYDRLFRSVHLWFHFAGKSPSEGTTSYDPKQYVHSTWTPPHWTIPPIALEECLTRFSTALNKLFKTRKGKNKSFASPTPSITNVNTTTNISCRPMR